MSTRTGANLEERTIVTRDGRRVVVVEEVGVRRLLHRVDCESAADAEHRATLLEGLVGATMPGLNGISSVQPDGATLLVTEPLVDGFSLGGATAIVEAHITVNVALAIAFDVVNGLDLLHRHAPGLIHGGLSANTVMISNLGETRVTHLSGQTGEPKQDIDAVMTMVRQLLSQRADSPQGGALLDRLAALRFDTASQLKAAIKLYLDRQDPGQLLARRAQFTSRVLSDLETDAEALPEVSFSQIELSNLPVDDDEDSTLADPIPEDLLHGDTSETKPRDALGQAPPWEDNSSSASSIQALPEEAWKSLEPWANEEMDGWPDQTLDPWKVDPELASQSDAARRVHPGDDEATDALIPVAEEEPSGDVRQGLLGKAGAVERSRGASKHVMVGDYRVVASIGRGGMGEIYLARQFVEGRPAELVALKVLTADEAGDSAALDMFLDEAAILARIDHPNILKVIDFGQAHGRYFLATEYLEGRPLVRVMIEAYSRESGLDYGTVAAIGADSAYGLYAAHTARGEDGRPLEVVHRDVSPQNIFVTFQGLAKVIDFGVARAAQRVSKTAVGLVKGKAAYMSPEQAEGRDTDARSDVFSLGICLWEMTAGKRLFKRDNDFDTLLAVQMADVEPPTRVRGEPDAVFDHIILGCLERDRSRRTQSARELAVQLVDYVTNKQKGERAGRMMDLMARLFGAQAKEERKLIKSLEAQTATPEELQALRDLSAVSREVAGRPSGLEDLEHFGSDQGFDASQSVLDAVNRVAAERAVPSEEIDDAPTRRLEEAALAPKPRAVSAIEIEDADFEVVSFVDSTGETEALPGRADTAVPTSGDAPVVAQLPTSNIGAAVPQISDTKDRSPTTVLGAEKRSRRLTILFSAGAVLLLLVAFGLFMNERARVTDGADMPPASTQAGRLEDGPLEDGMAAPTATVAPTSSTAEPVERAARTARTAPTVETSSTTFETMLASLRAQSVEVRQSGEMFLIPDGVGGTVILDQEGETISVTAGETRGFLIRSTSSSKTSLTWVGSVEAGPWYARGISVNDCPSTFRVHPSGVGLRYSGPEVMLPHGGGRLLDVKLVPPPNMNRVEIAPLGISLGREDDQRPGAHCSVGWWGKRVVLRRLPLGTYTLKWLGDGVVQSATLDVTASGITGGELVRTSTVPK